MNYHEVHGNSQHNFILYFNQVINMIEKAHVSNKKNPIKAC